MILVIDNYDSFVHNIARYFALLGAETRTERNDTLTIDAIRRRAPTAIVISPGPCTPSEAGISCAIIEELSGTIPILGVCLGHQCMGSVFGGRIVRARRPLHGQSSAIRHHGAGVFADVPAPFEAGRYHSLVVEPTPTMSAQLRVDAWSDEQEIMALSHRQHPTWGVQFHPESILTPCGLTIFATFSRSPPRTSTMPWLDAAWHPGAWIDAGPPPFDVGDRGLMLGDGLFDTALVLGGRMVWRQAHMDRLLSGCRTLGFMLDVSRVQRAVDAALERCTFGALRVTVTRGGGPRGLAPPSDPMPTVLATIAPLNASVLFSPVSLHVSAIRRNETSPTSRLKSLAYLDGVLAARAALDAGFDDALFLNTSGKVACTTVGNVLAVVGGQLVTPPIDDGVLEGIARRKILRTSDLLGLDAVERSIGLSDLDQADAVFVTNSLRLVAPVTAIDRKPFSGSLRGAALVTHVAKLVLEETGTDPRSLSSA